MNIKTPTHLMGFQYRAPFKEPLPTFCQCPTPKALPLTQQHLMRFAKSEQLDESDFWSHVRNGDPFPLDRACDFVGCSFFKTNIPRHKLNALRGFPNLKDKTKLVYVLVDEETGLAKINDKSGHVNIWFYASYDPVGSVVNVIGVDEYDPN